MEGSWSQTKFFKNHVWIIALWLLLPLANWIVDFPHDRYNNYKIFSSMLWHLIDQKNLYIAYPAEHGDLFFYGPTFSLIIAPFAVLPNIIGGLLWGVFNALILLYAINQLKLKTHATVLLMLLSTIELAISIWSHQFNPGISAMLIMSFVMVEKEKDFYAPFWFLLGTFTKIYGIVGALFFLFSKNKQQFIFGCIVWSVSLFAAPMIFSSPGYIIQTYSDWYNALALKNTQLISSQYSNLSVMGIAGVAIGQNVLSNVWFLVAGFSLVLLPLLRVKQYSSKYFRVLLLASLLMFVVLFSTGSEHPTYIICVVGLFLWIVLQNDIFSRRNLLIIGAVLILTGLGPTYLFSEQVALFILAYKLKALPCIIVWALLLIDLMKENFTGRNEHIHFDTQANAGKVLTK